MADRTFSGIVCLALAVMLAREGRATSETELMGLLKQTIEKVRTAELARAKRDAAEQLPSLTLKINPKDIDDKTLADLVSLLDNWDYSVLVPVATSLGNIGPRARVAVPALLKILPEVDCLWGDFPPAPVIRDALTRIGERPPPHPTCEARVDPVVWNQRIIETAAKVRSSESLAERGRGAAYLNYLTFWLCLGRQGIDDKAILALVSLLDTTEEPVRVGVTAALGNVGPRGRMAIPKLKALLAEGDCRPASAASAENIRYALRQMGVNPPTPNCSARHK